MIAEVTTALEYGSDRACQVGRIEYTLGVRRYVALTFRYLDKGESWSLTWVGEEGPDAVQLPDGVAPSAEMLEALAVALGETVGLQ